jgi:glutamate 5-kinase
MADVDWAKARKEILDHAKRLVIKVGSAVLTGPEGLDPRVFSRLVDQLATLHDRGLSIVLVSSGAVACGRTVIASLSELVDMPSKQAASAVGQPRLMREYNETFARYGKHTAQILLTREDFRTRERFLNARNTVRRLLDWRIIPVVNENDTVSTRELAFGDNDTLSSLMLNLVEADLFVNLTSTDGVFDANPQVRPDARRLPVVENIADLDLERTCDGKTVVGSGGMYSKLLAARRAAQLGVPTLIVSGRTPAFALEKAFAGEDLGTLVLPDGKAVSRRKYWMAYHDVPVGDLVVDAGAAKALEEKGKSLLPAGIVEVRGEFEAGGLVRILAREECGCEGRVIGVGLANYSSADLGLIKGRKSGDIAEVLGAVHYPEAVHRDNLLLGPAI